MPRLLQPTPLDLFERLALGFGHKAPNEDHRHGAKRRIDPKRKAVVKPLDQPGALIHVGECLRHEIIGHPEADRGDRHRHGLPLGGQLFRDANIHLHG